MSRTFFVGGNWKCNGTKSLVDQLVGELNTGAIPSQDSVEVVIAPPFLYLESVSKAVRKEVQVSAQNCWSEAKGAFTGEISAEMILDIGVKWVILGHSERRDIFLEKDEIVGKKVGRSLEAGLKVIACVGEHLEERDAGKTQDVIYRQLKAISGHVKDWKNVVVAYEPVWAIGTGKTATPQMAQEVHDQIRKWLGQNVTDDVAQSTRIIYGGSVKGSNANELAAMPDVDGFLVGGASLIGSEFITIINSASQKK